MRGLPELWRNRSAAISRAAVSPKASRTNSRVAAASRFFSASAAPAGRQVFQKPAGLLAETVVVPLEDDQPARRDPIPLQAQQLRELGEDDAIQVAEEKGLWPHRPVGPELAESRAETRGLNFPNLETLHRAADRRLAQEAGLADAADPVQPQGDGANRNLDQRSVQRGEGGLGSEHLCRMIFRARRRLDRAPRVAQRLERRPRRAEPFLRIEADHAIEGPRLHREARLQAGRGLQ
ncbi:hypothetical protein F9K50_10575, partial [bacterium]